MAKIKNKKHGIGPKLPHRGIFSLAPLATKLLWDDQSRRMVLMACLLGLLMLNVQSCVLTLALACLMSNCGRCLALSWIYFQY